MGCSSEWAGGREGIGFVRSCLSMPVVASELSEESEGDGQVGRVADGHFGIVVPVQSYHGSHDFHEKSAKFGFICMGFG